GLQGDEYALGPGIQPSIAGRFVAFTDTQSNLMLTAVVDPMPQKIASNAANPVVALGPDLLTLAWESPATAMSQQCIQRKSVVPRRSLDTTSSRATIFRSRHGLSPCALAALAQLDRASVYGFNRTTLLAG